MTAAQPARPCAALLLTGGASRRFGSAKTEMLVDGVRAADRLAAVLHAVADPVLEVGPGASPLDAVQEIPPGGGPLAAVAAGAEALVARGAGDRAVLVVAVDLPRVDTTLLRSLRDHPARGAVVPVLDGRPQTLCARYPREVHGVARRLVDAGVRAMRELLDACEVELVPEAEWTALAPRDALADVDTLADARRLGIETPG